MVANKSVSKGISLFFKTIIFTLSLYYIFYKINDISGVLDFNILATQFSWRYFIYALILMPVNWAIEAKKWKYLIRKTEPISFSTAYKSVLAGVSVGIFTPNRIGEFAGKIFFLKTEEKIKATIVSAIGGGLQLFVTIIAAFIAAFIYYINNKNVQVLHEYISLKKAIVVLVMLLTSLAITAYFYFKHKRFEEYRVAFSRAELFKGLRYSALRYLVFSLQYYYVVRCFGIQAPMYESILLIAFVFFVNTVIPTIAFTEIAVRTASGLFFFSTISNDVNAIIASSLILWIINLALPAIIGLMYVWQLNFIKE